MQYFEKQSGDFEELAQHLQAYDAQFKQIQGGQFAGRLAQLQLGPIVCMQVELSHSIIAKGILKKPAYVFTPVTDANHRAIWRGHTLSTRHVNILGAHEVMDHVAANHSLSTSIIIGKSTLEDLAATRWGFVLEDSLQHQVGIMPDAVSHQKLSNLVCEAFAKAAAGQTIDPSDFLDQVSEQLMNAFVSIDPRLEVKVNYNTRQRVIRLTHDFIMANLHRIVTVTELCLAAECSERTLQYAFQERYGLSPKEFMMIQRLNAVRSAIKQTQPARTKLTEMAKSWGFSHPGEYAASYRRLFGELPSQTRSRFTSVGVLPSGGHAIARSNLHRVRLELQHHFVKQP